MSAYNRQAARKKCPLSSESAMDESGYASFQVAHSLHNSTVEAPFLFERDSETENCRNAPNTSTSYHFPKGFMGSVQFQTPCSSDSDVTSAWRKSLSLPTANSNSSSALLSDDSANGTCKSPTHSQIHSATKRRKPHFQAPHNSPKKSKKKLFLQPDPLPQRRYYDGLEHLDIMGMLSNTQPALELILGHVSAQSLDVMTRVSKRWEHVVYKSLRAVERLHNHRLKMNLTKENPSYVVKRAHNTSNHHTITVPLQPSNAIPQSNYSAGSERGSGNSQLMDSDNGRRLVEQAQRIKCPRCSTSSKVYRSEVVESSNRSNRSVDRSALSRTLPLWRSSLAASSERHTSFTRFYSMEEMHSSPDEQQRAVEEPSYTFAECTGTFCKFLFCVHCCCKPHPGEKCRVSELGTPSKFAMPGENGTPPKGGAQKKFDSKLSRKNSLKRLNF